MNHKLASFSIMYSYWPISYITQGLHWIMFLSHKNRFIECWKWIIYKTSAKICGLRISIFRMDKFDLRWGSFKNFSLFFTLDIDLWLNQVLSKWYQDMIFYVYVWQMRNILLTNVLYYPDFTGQCPHPKALVLIHIEAPGWVQTVLHREYILEKDAILVH